jgi:hypothetical protein
MGGMSASKFRPRADLLVATGQFDYCAPEVGRQIQRPAESCDGIRIVTAVMVRDRKIIAILRPLGLKRDGPFQLTKRTDGVAASAHFKRDSIVSGRLPRVEPQCRLPGVDRPLALPQLAQHVAEVNMKARMERLHTEALPVGLGRFSEPSRSGQQIAKLDAAIDWSRDAGQRLPVGVLRCTGVIAQCLQLAERMMGTTMARHGNENLPHARLTLHDFSLFQQAQAEQEPALRIVRTGGERPLI